jgi:LPPG:FO 2-phospho-L-lactate transferase
MALSSGSLAMDSSTIVALAGGVGGAKMAQGIAGAVAAERLTVIVNTADDFELHGLRICPDLDTVLYTLAGIANPVTGWGIAGDTTAALDAMTRLGEDPWFIIGDQDLATHVIRTKRLQLGSCLSDVTREFALSLGIRSSILPVTDNPIATFIETPLGTFEFQDYFVRRRQQDDVLGVRVAGVEDAEPAPGVLEAIETADVILICPSNPIVSIGPILDVPGIRHAIEHAHGIRIAVSPIIGGRALKGPADKMLSTLGHESSALAVARIYAGLIDGMVIDETDAELSGAIGALGMKVATLQTVMGDADDRARLASEILAFARTIERSIE